MDRISKSAKQALWFNLCRTVKKMPQITLKKQSSKKGGNIVNSETIRKVFELKMKNLLFCSLSCIAISACSGGSQGNSYAALETSGNRILDQARDEAFTAPSVLDVSDTVSYSGIIYGNWGATSLNDGYVAGTLSIDVDFADSSVDGSVDDVRTRRNDAYSGSLSVRGAVVPRDDLVGLEGLVEGTIVSPNGAVVVVDGGMIGAFVGENGEYATGNLVGSVTSDGQFRRITESSFATQRQ